MFKSYTQSTMIKIILPTLLLGFNISSLNAQQFKNNEIIIQWRKPITTSHVQSLTTGYALPSYIQKRGTVKRKPLSLSSQVQSLTQISTHSNSQNLAQPFSEWELIEFTDPQNDLENLIHQLNNDATIEYAQPNYIYSNISPINPTQKIQPNTLENFEPNDPYFDQQTHHLHNNIQKAWQITQGNNVIIAVIDTGIDVDHPDFVNNAWINTNEINGNGIDDDNNGYIDDIIGWDFPNNDAIPEDADGHGSHVAGIASGDTNNGIGISGAGFNNKIMSLKVGQSDSFTTFHISQAINYAIKNNADIINMSFGGVRTNGDPLMESVIASANTNGILCIASAGNDDSDVNDAPIRNKQGQILGRGRVVPATIPGVLTVSAAGTNGIFDDRYSNYGSNVALIAQGSSVLSYALTESNPEVPYRYLTGTSMSSPYVAGLASLLKAAKQSLTSANLFSILIQTATDLGESGFDHFNGYGKPNIFEAIRTQDLSAPQSSHNPPSTINIGQSTTITLTSTDDIISFQYPMVTLNFKTLPDDTVTQHVKLTKNGNTYSYTFPAESVTKDIKYSYDISDIIPTHNSRLPINQTEYFTIKIRDLTGPEITFLQEGSDETILKNNDYFSPDQIISIQLIDNTEIIESSLQVTINGTLYTTENPAITLLTNSNTNRFRTFNTNTNTLQIDLNQLTLGESTLTIEISVEDEYANQSTATLSLKPSSQGSLEFLGSDGQPGVFNHPNPFKPNEASTKIGFQLSQEASVKCIIYTMNLNRIKTFEETKSAGYHEFIWDGRDSTGEIVPNGVYPMFITAESESGHIKSKHQIIVLQ